MIQYRRSLSTPVLPGHSPNANRKSMERETSFTDFGQRLKVEKIITGHHPTSQRTTVAPKRDVSIAFTYFVNVSTLMALFDDLLPTHIWQPWETECVAEEFPYKIVYGDSCGEK